MNRMRNVEKSSYETDNVKNWVVKKENLHPNNGARTKAFVLAIRNNVFLLYAKNLLVSLKFGILFTELERSLCFNSSHF
jgi:hypothetical protein